MNRSATSIGTAGRRASERPVSVWEHLAALMPVEVLNAEFGMRNAGRVEIAHLAGDSHAAAGRTLYRSRRGNLLITGRKGVGKTTFVRELARLAATGELPFLEGRRFVRIDCRNVGPEDSRACLESIFTAVATTPDIVLCLDGMGAVLKRTNGGSNKPLLRAMLGQRGSASNGDGHHHGYGTGETPVAPDAFNGPAAANDTIRRAGGVSHRFRGNSPTFDQGLRLIGIMSDWEYADLIGGDADMLELFTRLQIEEPNEDTALAIARHHAWQLSREFDLEFDDHIVERTVTLASTFILNECQPAKSIDLLRQVCEDKYFNQTQQPTRERDHRRST